MATSLPASPCVERTRNGSRITVHGRVVQMGEGWSYFPGRTFQLLVPMSHPQDGAPSQLTVEMVGGEATLLGDGLIVRGFVSKQQLAYEKAFFDSDWEACADAMDRDDLADEYVFEEWKVLGA